jgi:radical SAM superfamily enzyme YgiQ (UPF0313 family)
LPSLAPTEILLCTLNARYIHCAFGLRYLQANLGSLQSRSKILEFTISQAAENPGSIVDALLAHHPRIVGFGVYIWNATQTLEVVRRLRQASPEIRIVLGGPEVSYETESQEIVQLADHTIRGEADLLFRELCQELLSEPQSAPFSSSALLRLASKKIIEPELPPLQALALPYSLYSDEDLRNRVIYVEASRGCAFKCEYCLSSLDLRVRSFDLARFLAEIDSLIQRGARQFKFVDRTFNLSPKTSTAILEFFLSRSHLGLFLHFEMVPDRLPEELRRWIVQFPPGSLQFEIGIQTWNPEVSARVSRRQDTAQIEKNIQFLRSETGVHLHADLIAGLPGETLESFGQGFDRLARLNPHEIQLGILKRLRGTPIIRHDSEWGMSYSSEPPYEIQKTHHLSAEEISELKRVSKVWDLIANRGYFKSTFELLRTDALFAEMRHFTRFVWGRFGRTHSIDLMSLAEALYDFLIQHREQDAAVVSRALLADLQAPEVRPIPSFLKPFWLENLAPRRPNKATLSSRSPLTPSLPKRQKRFQTEEKT